MSVGVIHCAPISRELEGTKGGENTLLCPEPSWPSERAPSHLCGALCKSPGRNGPRTDHVYNSVKKKKSLFALESVSSPKCLAKSLLAFSKASLSSSLTTWYRQATGMQEERLNASIARVPSALRVH